MRKLKIAQIAPLWYPIPPKKYGGIERVVHYLTEELVARGHNVELFASGNSQTKAKLRACRSRGLAEDKIPWTDTFWSLEHLSFCFKTIEKLKGFDIIHAHTGIRTFFFQCFTKSPVLHTFHNPLTGQLKNLPPALEVLKRYRNNANVIFLSRAHKKLCQIKIKKSWVVYNGIDENLFTLNLKPKDYFLWVGRIEKAKGVENAIKAAKIAKIRLYLVGKIDPEKNEYFNKKIKPHLSEEIKYLGERSQKELVALYQNARALLYPVEWQEPFGLVMTEALACGTPVIVFDRGSAQEIVKQGKTGYVLPLYDERGEKNIAGLVTAIRNVNKIDRRDCRRWVEAKFTVKKMVDHYENLYYKLAKKKN